MLEVCDSVTLDCTDINSIAAQNAARRAFKEKDASTRRLGALAAGAEAELHTQRRQYGFEGARYCPEYGMYVRVKLEIPVSSAVSAYQVQQVMLNRLFGDKLDAIFRHNLGEAGMGYYAEAPDKDDENPKGMCMNVMDAGLPGLAQGRIGWVYNVSCFVPEGTEQTETHADENGTNVTVVTAYAGDKECRPKLVDCPEGYLYVNTSEETTRCSECKKGTYSFEAFDGCMPDGPNGEVVCRDRVCNPCPDDPIGGAICCGKNIFFELTEGSVWENFDFQWPDGHWSVVRRLMACPIGYSLIRDDADPTSDHCLQCPPYTFSLEDSKWVEQERVYPSKQAWSDAMADKVTRPCNPCPPGSTCFGGNKVNASRGYWGDPEPFLCPPEACTVDSTGGEVCDTLLCFLPPGAETTERRRLLMAPSSKRRQAGSAGTAEECGPDCRLRVYVHTCPAGGCELNGECAEGRTGPACGLCVEGLQMVGAECLSCDYDPMTLILVALLVFAPFLIACFYFFSWKPLLFRNKKAPEEEDAREATWLASKALNSKTWKVVYVSWEFIKQEFREFTEVDHTAYIKIIISFYNIVGTYPIVYNIYWPDLLATIMQITNSVAGVDFLGIPGFSCLGISLPYTTKLLISTITPVAINLVFFIAPLVVMVQGMVIRGHPFKHPRFPDTISRFCWSMAFTMALYFPPVSIQVLSSFRCDKQLNLLTSDYSEVCPLNDPTGFIFRWSVLCTILYPIGIPCAMYWMMWYYSVPHIAKVKLNKVLFKTLVEKYQSANATQESEILVRIIGNVSDRQQFEKRVGELFEMIDKDGGGSLDLPEMIEAFQTFGMANVNVDKIKALMAKFTDDDIDDDSEIHFDSFLDIISEMTAASFLFSGLEESVEECTIDQQRALCSYDWNRVVRNKKLGETDKNETDTTSKLFLPDLEDPASMCAWILQKARDLRAQGHIALPSIPWDQSTPEEKLAVDRLGMVFAKYKVEYWYYELFDMLKKILMTSVLSFCWYGTASQLFLGFFLLAAFLLSMLRSQPYDNASLNNFNVYSYLIQCVVLLYGICIVADTDVDDDASDTFRKGFMADLIVFVTITVALFPLAQAALGSKLLKRVGSQAKRRVRKTVSDILDAIFPSRITKRNMVEKRLAAKRLREARENKDFSQDGIAKQKFGPADAVITADDEEQPQQRIDDKVNDMEMVPGFNCGPGVFRIYDQRPGPEGVASELVFTAQGAELSSTDGSGASFTASDSEEEDSRSILTASDLRPAPRLGPARVRDVDPGLSVSGSVESSRRGSFESSGVTPRMGPNHFSAYSRDGMPQVLESFGGDSMSEEDGAVGMDVLTSESGGMLT